MFRQISRTVPKVRPKHLVRSCTRILGFFSVLGNLLSVCVFTHIFRFCSDFGILLSFSILLRFWNFSQLSGFAQLSGFSSAFRILLSLSDFAQIFGLCSAFRIMLGFPDFCGIWLNFSDLSLFSRFNCLRFQSHSKQEKRKSTTNNECNEHILLHCVLFVHNFPYSQVSTFFRLTLLEPNFLDYLCSIVVMAIVFLAQHSWETFWPTIRVDQFSIPMGIWKFLIFWFWYFWNPWAILRPVYFNAFLFKLKNKRDSL